MNKDANKIGGKKYETTREYPEYFLIRWIDDCLADSRRSAISLFENSLVSGISIVRTNMNWMFMAKNFRLRLLDAVTDWLVPGCPADRAR
jgi:hypothetical protein